MFFGLLLLGGIIFVSNRTYPGDDLYSFKLKFESFALATSKILNKQVDFSIDLVSRRSNEVAKILTPKNSEETLSRLDTQIESTAVSIAQISDPVEKKKAATKYITKLNEVSSVLSEKQKEFVAEPQSALQPTVQPNTQQPSEFKPTERVSQDILPSITPTSIPTSTPAPEIATVSEQLDNTQQTIQQAIDEMTDLATDNNFAPTENDQQKDKDEEKKDRKDNNDKKDKD